MLPSLLLAVVLLAANAHADFNYSNPSIWYIDYPTCGGASQSPIALPRFAQPQFGVVNATFGALMMNETVGCSVADADFVSHINNEKTVKVVFNSTKQLWCTLRSPRTGRLYQFTQLHLHNSSEHQFGGAFRDACIHLVWNAVDPPKTDTLVVEVSLLETEGTAGRSPSPLIDYVLLPYDTPNFYQRVVDTKVATLGRHLQFLRLDSLFPSTKAYWHYSGSLTTPPCTEGVEWYVFRDGSPTSVEALQRFTSSMRSVHPQFAVEGNARPPQPINGRTIYYVSNEPESVADEGSSSFEAEWVIMGALMLGAAAAVAWTERTHRQTASRFSSSLAASLQDDSCAA